MFFRFSLLALAVVPELCLAGRAVIAPPYMRRIIFNFNPTPATPPPDGTPLGAIMNVSVTLSNLSDVPQTGRVFLMAGSGAGAGEVARTVAPNVHWSLCGGGAAGSDNAPPSAPVTFSVGANGTAEVRASIYITSTFNAAGPTGNTSFDAVFNPIIKIEVDQDRGALNATMVPTWDGPVPPYSTCDGAPYVGSAMADVSESRTGVPLLINGGRPF